MPVFLTHRVISKFAYIWHKSLVVILQKSLVILGLLSEVTSHLTPLPIMTPFRFGKHVMLQHLFWVRLHVLQMPRKKLIWSSAQLQLSAHCWRPMGMQWQRTNHTEAGHRQSTWRAYWGEENSPPHVPLHAIVIQPFYFICFFQQPSVSETINTLACDHLSCLLLESWTETST